MLKAIGRLIREDDGQGMVEYALILGLIAVVVITLLTTIGSQTEGIFTKIKEALEKPSDITEPPKET